MFIKNNSPKIIGFGAAHILSGDTGALPEGFGRSHPTVQFFVGRGLIEILDGDPAENPSGDDATDENEPEGDKTPPAPPASNNAAFDVAALTPRDVSRMNLQPLRDLAAQLGLESAGKTRSELIEKISGLLFPGEDCLVEDPSDYDAADGTE